MYKFFGVAGLIFAIGLSAPASASSQTLTTTNQIRVTATILPARHILVDANMNILQIINNTSQAEVVPTVYVGSIKPENVIPTTPNLSAEVDKILAGMTLEPGILYDYRTEDVVPPKSANSTNNMDIWLSGIFNLKNVNPTVNLMKL